MNMQSYWNYNSFSKKIMDMTIREIQATVTWLGFEPLTLELFLAAAR